MDWLRTPREMLSAYLAFSSLHKHVNISEETLASLHLCEKHPLCLRVKTPSREILPDRLLYKVDTLIEEHACNRIEVGRVIRNVKLILSLA